MPLRAPPTAVTVNVSPSTSVSLATRSLAAIVSAVSSAVVFASLTATGASLTAVIVTVTAPVAVPPWPSLTV